MEKEMRKEEKLHFLIIPYLGPGHILPSIDLGRLLASRGNLVTIITTPSYVARFDTAIENEQPLRFAAVPPRQEGGCESADGAKTSEDLLSVLETSKEMEEPVKEWIEKEKMGVDGSIPMCMVSEYCQMWTRNLASELGMVRFLFNCTGCFPLVCEAILQESFGVAGEEEASDNREIVVTGIPDRVAVTKAQVPSYFLKGTTLYDEFLEAYETSDGIILNTFNELEPDYIHLYQKFKGKKKVWPIGPVGLINKDITNKIHRGTNTSSTVMIDRLSTFLNSKPPDSIIYFCMGSLTGFSFSQMIEIGLGLEGSNYPFLWVIKHDDRLAKVESWLKESKFEERNRLNGFIIKGWAPQMMILSHPSVGGFFTHCGWNSTMEGITAGVPMLTWPCFSDQFLNERFLVDVLKNGVMTGVKEPTCWWDDVLSFKSGDIKKSVKELMGCDEEAVMRRKRARALRGMAELAMGVDGSTQTNLDAFVHDAFSIVHKNM